MGMVNQMPFTPIIDGNREMFSTGNMRARRIEITPDTFPFPIEVNSPDIKIFTPMMRYAVENNTNPLTAMEYTFESFVKNPIIVSPYLAEKRKIAILDQAMVKKLCRVAVFIMRLFSAP